MKAALLFDQVCSLGPLAATSCLVKRYWRTMESQESSVGSREERGALGRKREGGVCVARARARERERERERQRDRQTDRQRQTDRDRETETDRQTDRQIETDRDRDRQTETETDRQAIRQRQRTRFEHARTKHRDRIVLESGISLFSVMR